VALREDFPHHQLCRGDIATIAKHHSVKDEEDDHSLEVSNVIGEAIVVLVVCESQIEPLKSHVKPNSSLSG